MSSSDNKADHLKHVRADSKGGASHKTDHHVQENPKGTPQNKTEESHAKPEQKDRQPTLRGAIISGMHAHRPRAGTFGSRKDAHHVLRDRHHHHGKDHDRNSQSTDDHHHHAHHLVEYENTYRMEPDFKFHESAVNEIISKVLKECLKEKEYDHDLMNGRITLVCSRILDDVKKLDMKRYKFVSHVIVGEDKSSSVQMSSRCLWDKRWDNFTSATVSNGNVYATGMVFGIYAE